MPITNKVKFVNQEKTTTSSTSATSPTYAFQGTMLDAGNTIAGNEYFMLSWVNCTSPGTSAGGTKWSFEGGAGDIVGSNYQRHDTNSSGMYVAHIGQFTAPNPTQNIGIYRTKIAGSGPEETDYGQFFAIDLSYSGASGQLVSGVDFSSTTDTSNRTKSNGQSFHDHQVNHSGTNLICASIKTVANPDPVLIGLYVDGVLVSSGSRFTESEYDVKSTVFAGAYNIGSGDYVSLKNLDPDAAETDYSYIFVLNLDTAPTTQTNQQLSSWTDSGGSGTWGTKVIDGNQSQSVVVGMGRQLETGVGAESGRPAAISLKNNTEDEWLIFNERPSGNFNPLYFPAVNYSLDTGQRETAIVVGTGKIGDSDTIEMVTL